MGETRGELREHMLRCHGMCWWLSKKKLYYCSNAWSAQEIGLTKLNEKQDYVDLIRVDDEYLIDIYYGNMIGGYMSHCKKCRGFASTQMIKACVQMERV